MVKQNLKGITVVPSGKDFVDIVLSRTQRQTPTVVHKGYAISRIRQFYMRKVKFTQSTFDDKLGTILDEFPHLDDMHPFYADLVNVLYDRDHYKLALAQLNTAKRFISTVSKDYVRLLKCGDSLYRCKLLKKAALGRMCTLMKRVSPSLAYLEQVRQHMARLPSIDPNTRTLIICGYPNVGKSSFINKVTRADVDVQPYAFTTKSLFVGHTDYKYLRWQVIDTPGILDHPLEDRNTIEMLSITALAHLRAAVLFFVDISASCGYSIQQQAELFRSILPLFHNKPVLVVCSKIDLMPLEALGEEERKVLEEMKREAGRCSAGIASEMEVDGEGCLVCMSSITEEGVVEVKNAACEKLLQHRVEQKIKSKKLGGCLNRIHVAVPQARDSKDRPPCIPASVLQARALNRKPERKLEKDLENENGGAGVYSSSLTKRYMLGEEEWKEDVIAEILDGKNIADYIDSDILQRMDELEREEVQRLAAADDADVEMSGDDLTPEELEAVAAIRMKKRKIQELHRMKKRTAESRPIVPRKHDKDKKFTVERMGRELARLGMDPSAAMERARSASRGRKRERSAGTEDGEAMQTDEHKSKRLKLASRSRSRSRPLTSEVVTGEGFKDSTQKKKALALGKKAARKRNKLARRGEADRTIINLKPKHLFAGKRSMGKTDRR